MPKIALLPGDGYGPSIIEAAKRTLEMSTSDIEIVCGDIGFAAYERTGEHMPYDTKELALECGSVICGPVKEYKDDAGRLHNPLEALKADLDLYAVSRSFRTLADDLGVPGMDITLWASNMTLGSDVIESRDIDGITISKYIRSSSYSRMMARALSDMELSGKGSVVCITQDNIFPDSSTMFSEAFDSLFPSDVFRTEHRNVEYWALKFVRNPLEFDYIICADLYSNVTGGMLAGLSGGNRLTPITYVGENCNLFVPGLYKTFEDVPRGYSNPTSAIKCASKALFDMGRTKEASAIIEALIETYAAGERTPDVGGDLTTEEFTDRVVSRL